MDDDLIEQLHYITQSQSILSLDNENPLLRAVRTGNIEKVGNYLNSQNDLEALDKQGNTALHLAAEHGNLEILDLLLIATGINLNSRNNAGDTPLLVSLRVNQFDEFVFHLLEAGCNANMVNNRNQHPLHFAVQRYSVAIAKYLIEKGADINLMDNCDSTPLCYAIAANNIEAISMLLYYSVNLELGYMDLEHVADVCPLLSAAYNVNPMVIHMVQLGANVNRFTYQMNTVLEYSLYYDTADLFKVVWKDFDLRLLFGFDSFLHTFISYCRFNKSDWLECLFTLFCCPVMNMLIKSFESEGLWKYSNLDITLLRALFYAFFEKNVDVEDRVLLINLFLTSGEKITVLKSDINLIAELFGTGLELEALISYPVFGLDEFIYLRLDHLIDKFIDRDQYYPLSAFFMVAEENYNTGHIVNLFEYQIFYINGIFHHEQFVYGLCSFFKYLSKAENRLQCLLDSFSYFSLPPCAKQRIGKTLCSFYGKDKVHEKLQEMPEFPSLKELSRNQTRVYVKGCRKHNTAFEFYQIVNRLNAPDFVKKQITFRCPLY